MPGPGKTGEEKKTGSQQGAQPGRKGTSGDGQGTERQGGPGRQGGGQGTERQGGQTRQGGQGGQRQGQKGTPGSGRREKT